MGISFIKETLFVLPVSKTGGIGFEKPLVQDNESGICEVPKIVRCAHNFFGTSANPLLGEVSVAVAEARTQQGCNPRYC